ncbi:MAG: hypothetical protein QM650_06780 [Microlunatus sp.]
MLPSRATPVGGFITSTITTGSFRHVSSDFFAGGPWGVAEERHGDQSSAVTERLLPLRRSGR